MDDFIEVAHSSELPTGSKKSVVVNGRKLLVCHTDKGWFAADNSCPHRGGPLSEGDLIGDSIVCPWHVWTFDLQSGCNDINPEFRLRTHEIRIDDESVLVKLSDGAGEFDVR